jgi:hypothetical protein
MSNFDGSTLKGAIDAENSFMKPHPSITSDEGDTSLSSRRMNWQKFTKVSYYATYYTTWL